jgi:uncharacterized membrane protein YhhN
MKTPNIIYQLWHIGFIGLLLNSLGDTLKIGKGVEFYYLSTLLVFIVGLMYYYIQKKNNKKFDIKTIIVIMFFELIVFWFTMAMIHDISWGQENSDG